MTKSSQTVFPMAWGYRMPAEWEPHEATWLSWPHNQETWPTQLERVQQIYLSMIQALAPGEKVFLLVENSVEEEVVRGKFKAEGIPLEQVRFFQISTEDAWIRDYGPIGIVQDHHPDKPRRACLNWVFNAWGEKYESLMRDNQVPEELQTCLELPFYETGLILEGGSIDVNGQGTLLTTEQCLLNPNRNSGMGREEIEHALKLYFGVSQIIWLKQGIEGDDTDGHIDDIARFVSPNTIVAVTEENESDPNALILEENLALLQATKNAIGESFQVVTLPSPGVVEMPEEGRLPASYVNFYIGNAAVMVPTFDHPNDSVALETLSKFFPGRRIVGIPCRDLVYGLGTLHCVTQQLPA